MRCWWERSCTPSAWPGRRASFDEEREAFTYLKQHKDMRYSACDGLSFVVMLKLGIEEAWTFDGHFAHRFTARPGPS